MKLFLIFSIIVLNIGCNQLESNQWGSGTFNDPSGSSQLDFPKSDLPQLINSQLANLKQNTPQESLNLKMYLDEIEDLLSQYYQSSVTYSFVEIDGRSLLKNFENFMFRRKLVEFSLVDEKNKLVIAFLAFSPLSDEFEVIVWDEQSKRYEFILVKSVKPQSTKKLNAQIAQRSSCTSCHQAGAGIFARAPWGETHFLFETAFIFRAGDQLAKERNLQLYNFLNDGLEINIDQSELNRRIPDIAILSFKDQIESFDDSIRQSNSVVLTSHALDQLCDKSDIACKQNVLLNILNYQNDLDVDNLQSTYEIASSILPDLVPHDEEGFVIGNFGLTNLSEGSFSSTYTKEPKFFDQNENFVSIKSFESKLPNGVANPLLPISIRPKVDRTTGLDAVNKLKENSLLQKIILGFNSEELKKKLTSEADQIDFIKFLTRIPIWPLNKRLFTKYLNRYNTKNFEIDPEISAKKFIFSNDELGKETSVGEGITTKEHKILIETCQACHTSETQFPIDFSNLEVIFEYKNKGTDHGQTLLDSIEQGTMPPQSTTNEFNKFNINKLNIINFIKNKGR